MQIRGVEITSRRRTDGMMGRKETIMCTPSDVDVVLLLLKTSPDPPRSHYCGLPDGNLRINRPKSLTIFVW